MNVFGFLPLQWNSGSALNNTGEAIELKNSNGDLMDIVAYSSGNGWPSLATGQGSSLELCNFLAENNDPNVWVASANATGIVVNSIEIKASPGEINDAICQSVVVYNIYNIGQVTGVNTDGIPDSVGVNCQLTGTVYGVNLRPTGLQFTLIDQNNDGINVFYPTGNFNYMVLESNKITVQGGIGQFNGLIQINPDTIWIESVDPQWRTRVSSSPIGYYEPLTVDSALVQPTQLWGASFFAGYRLGQPLSYTGFAVYDGKAETTAIGELRLGFTLPLWRNRGIDRARASLRRAEIGQEIADLSVLQQQLETARTATLRYWEWVAAGRRLAVQQSLLDLAQARDEGLGQRVARGDIPPFERTDNRRAIVQREGAVVAARRALEQATIELALYLRDAEGRATLLGP